MTSAINVDLRVGDRITVLPGKARSGHTYRSLTRGFAIEVTHARRDIDGEIEVEGVLLTTRGAWRSDLPTRSVILPPGSYTVPIRVGDTVHNRQTGEASTVTAIHVRPDGTAVADLLFTNGSAQAGYHLAALEPGTRRGGDLAATGTDVADELRAVVGQERLAHPNPYACAHCATNRATLRLTLADGEQVTVCRPHASRYPAMVSVLRGRAAGSTGPSTTAATGVDLGGSATRSGSVNASR